MELFLLSPSLRLLFPAAPVIFFGKFSCQRMLYIYNEGILLPLDKYIFTFRGDILAELSSYDTQQNNRCGLFPFQLSDRRWLPDDFLFFFFEFLFLLEFTIEMNCLMLLNFMLLILLKLLLLDFYGFDYFSRFQFHVVFF